MKPSPCSPVSSAREETGVAPDSGRISRVVQTAIATIVLISVAALFLVVTNHQARRKEALKVYQSNFLNESERVVNRFREINNLNYLIGNDPTVLNTLYKLAHRQHPTQIARLITEKVLGNIAAIPQVDAAYLLNPDGRCVFASRHDFLDKDYGFRPYFTTALDQGSGVYFARGVTSGVVGLYVSQLVSLGGEKLGVSVIKVNPLFLHVNQSLSFVSHPPGREDLAIGLAMEGGVFVDIRDRKVMVLEKMDGKMRKRIVGERITDPDDVSALGFPPGSWQKITREGRVRLRSGGRSYIVYAAPVSGCGIYFLHIVREDWLFSEYRPVSRMYIGLLSVFALMLIFCANLIYLLNQRHSLVQRQASSLAESQEQLRLFSRAVEQSGNSIVITDTTGAIQYVNPHFTQVTGYTAQEALGQNPRILKSGEQDETVYKDLWETLSRGETWRGTLHNRRKNGETYWEEATISPIIDSRGRVTHYVAIKEDISDRIALTQRLKEESAKLTLIVEHAGLGMAIISKSRFAWVNQAGVELFGYRSDAEVVGRETVMIFPDRKTWQRFRDNVEGMLAQNHTVRVETRMRHRSGKLIWCALTGKALDSEQLDRGEIWIVEDITRRKQNEEELRRAKEEAESAHVMKSRLLANVSHDIRTPLHGIIGIFNLLKQGTGEQQERKLVENGLHAANFLLSLLNTLLDLSRIEARQLVLEKRPFEVRSLARELTSMFASQAEEKGLTLDIEVSSRVPEVLIGDSLRIRQILVNLVGNSLKFTHQGGISVEIRGEREENLFRLTCEVRDTGIGIAADRQKTVFNSFVQADNSITRKYGGTGLGLSISRELCRLMGGDIRLKSAPGQGTSFCFTIPCPIGEGNQEAPARREELDRSGVGALRVLIVDDNPTNRDILSMMLERDGHQVLGAGNGLQALKVLCQNRVDLIFMDMQMPVMDGLQATRIIRQCERADLPAEQTVPGLSAAMTAALAGRRTPIVALTANALEESKQQCLEAGMDEFLVKPFGQDELHRLLQRLFADSKEEAPAGSETEPVPPAPAHEEAEAGQAAGDALLPRVRRYLEENYTLSGAQIQAFIDRSVKMIARDLEQLTGLLERGECRTGEITAAAHKLKGALLSLGLEELAGAMARLEEAARQEEREQCRRQTREVAASLALLERELAGQ